MRSDGPRSTARSCRSMTILGRGIVGNQYQTGGSLRLSTACHAPQQKRSGRLRWCGAAGRRSHPRCLGGIGGRAGEHGANTASTESFRRVESNGIVKRHKRSGRPGDESKSAAVPPPGETIGMHGAGNEL
jgi:hypothetical protein